MTRQQRFQKLVAEFEEANRSGSREQYETAKYNLAVYVIQNEHRITVRSGK